MARDDAGEAFWRFSLMVYARPGVADALLRLQDQGGHNINVILFGLWCAMRGQRLDAAALARGRTAIAGLDGDVVQPLRRLRRALTGSGDSDIDDIRRRALALELAAERRVQRRLAATATPPAAQPGAHRSALADANLRLILGADCAGPDAALVLHSLAERRDG
jgi:uncharacterized protein (TIGR02444 family)